ncbi:hypothetical protein CL635_02830 [bacterium]|nr:hypothetical protein [bacterium]
MIESLLRLLLNINEFCFREVDFIEDRLNTLDHQFLPHSSLTVRAVLLALACVVHMPLLTIGCVDSAARAAEEVSVGVEGFVHIADRLAVLLQSLLYSLKECAINQGAVATL